MKVIEISANSASHPRCLERHRAERPRTESRAGRGAHQSRRRGRQPARRDSALRQIPAASGCVRHSRSRSRRTHRRPRGGRRAVARGRSGVRAGERRRLRRVLRGAAIAMPTAALTAVAGRSGRGARNLLHRLDQRLRARALAARGDDSHPRRDERHRDDRDSAGGGVWRAGLRDGGERREGRGVPDAGRGAGGELPDDRLGARSVATPPTAAASTSCSTSSAATTWRAISKCSRSKAASCRSRF